MRFPFFIFLSAFVQAQTITPHGAKIVAASVAMVGDRVITKRDAQVSVALQKVIGKIKTVDWGVEIDPVSQAILDLIAAKEAGSFQLPVISEKQNQEALKKVRDSGVMQGFALSDQDLRTMVEEKLRADQFLALRSEGLKTVVTDQEVRDFYEKHKSRYTSMPFEQFKDVMRCDLEIEQRQRRFLEWFEVLKQKYKVRIYGQPNKAFEKQ